MIRISCSEFNNFEALLEKEWLETDGLGGYASSTVLNCHSRKYHGLMVANLDNPGGRFVLLSKCDDSVRVHDKEFFLSVHKYPMGYYPHEDHFLSYFTLDLYPRFIYQLGEAVLEKELMLVRGENTLLMRYYVSEAPCPVRLTVRPLLAYRGVHELARENLFLRQHIEEITDGFSISPYDGMPDLYIQTNRRSRFYPSPQWYRNFEYPKERDRGFSYSEDLFMPGMFECDIPPGGEMLFYISLNGNSRKIESLWKKETVRREKLREAIRGNCEDSESFKTRLHISAGDFIIRNRKDRLSIIAGYHWFYEWGRDSLISLPGLTFCTNRITEGIEILKNLAELRKDGLIPNNVSEKDNENAYNSVDSSLWYYWCVQELLKVKGEPDFIMKEFWSVLIDIASHYYFGTSEHIRMLDNGLLNVGDSSTQLTWMDATANGVPVTPRHGCPVEINALWFNAMCLVQKLAREFGRDVPFEIDGLIEKISKSFELHFWIPDKQYLADRWIPDGNYRDESLRPNQLLAVSLPFSVVGDREKAASIVRRVSEELLTPYGLRTLSPSDPRYKGRYSGTPWERDSAYHQGTVWPWLLGHYGEALLKTEENRKSSIEKLEIIVANMENHLCDAGLGHISEIFSGDYPHEPCGCIAQAWSIAEIIRLQALMGH